MLITSLKERMAETREAILTQGEANSPEIVSLMQRLESLVDQASQYLDGAQAEEKSAPR